MDKSLIHLYQYGKKENKQPDADSKRKVMPHGT